MTGRLRPAKADGEGVLEREAPCVAVPVDVLVLVAVRDADALPVAVVVALTLPVALEGALRAPLALGEPLATALGNAVREGCGEAEALTEPHFEIRATVAVASPVAPPVTDNRAELLAEPEAEAVGEPQKDALPEAPLLSVADGSGLTEAVVQGVPLDATVKEKEGEEAAEGESAADAVPSKVADTHSVAAADAEAGDPDEVRLAGGDAEAARVAPPVRVAALLAEGKPVALCIGVNVSVPVGAAETVPTMETLIVKEVLPEGCALALRCGVPLALPEGEPEGRDQALREREAEALLEGLTVVSAFEGDIERVAAAVAQAEELRVEVTVTEVQGVALAVPLR